MTDHAFVLDLAKLMIAAAWADGELTNDEINALKDLLFTIGEVSGDEWAMLEMYMESPPSDAERDALIARTLQHVRSAADKAFVVNMLEKLFHSDGEFTPDEEALLNQLRGDLAQVDTGLFANLGKAFRSAMRVRDAAVRNSCLREADHRDYIHNTIYYDLKRRGEAAQIALEHGEAELRKACLAVGLLAHVAHADDTICDGEHEAIKQILATDLELGENEASLLADVSRARTTRGLDYFRLSNGYFDVTTLDERRAFIKTLFRVASALNKTSYEETEEIRKISASLKVDHKDFIDAKMSVIT